MLGKRRISAEQWFALVARSSRVLCWIEHQIKEKGMSASNWRHSLQTQGKIREQGPPVQEAGGAGKVLHIAGKVNEHKIVASHWVLGSCVW